MNYASRSTTCAVAGHHRQPFSSIARCHSSTRASISAPERVTRGHQQPFPVDLQPQFPADLVGPDFAHRGEHVIALRFRDGEIRLGAVRDRHFQISRWGMGDGAPYADVRGAGGGSGQLAQSLVHVWPAAAAWSSENRCAAACESNGPCHSGEVKVCVNATSKISPESSGSNFTCPVNPSACWRDHAAVFRVFVTGGIVARKRARGTSDFEPAELWWGR